MGLAVMASGALLRIDAVGSVVPVIDMGCRCCRDARASLERLKLRVAARKASRAFLALAPLS
jgi:hypothetical protein